MLKFWELAPSPNNVKVRMALRFKGIDFETVPVDPRERSAVREVSGQDLTPVIEDRGIVLNDSEAILQYLDANYPDAPRLFPRERDGRKKCDAFKNEIDGPVVAGWLPVFFHAIGRRDDLDENALKIFHDLLKRWDDELAERSSFGGDEAPISDLRVAEWAVYALPGEGLIERCRLFGRLRERYRVEAGRLPRLERFLEPWNARLA